MPELDIGHADEDKLNFDQSSLQFDVKKKTYAKSSSRFGCKCWVQGTGSFGSYFRAIIMPT